ncbi:MAG: hypothetical protein IJJ23_02300 [Clostridia bacterium]|nr:hypothetical protein [Clostridia bacterium]
MFLFDEKKKFFKGNLHTHTTNSDGRRSPEEVYAIYKAQGYDFLAITDHWKRTVDRASYYEGMLLLPGIELDYNLLGQVVHVVGIGVNESILTSAVRGQPLRKGLNSIALSGGVAILAHPAWSLNTADTIAQIAPQVVAAEIYNSVSSYPWNGDRADSTCVLDVAASQGTIINTVASDDSHFYEGEQCRAFICLQADSLTEKDVIQALASGAFYASQGPRVHQVEITPDGVEIECDPVSAILFHSDMVYAHGRCVSGDGLTHASYTFHRDALERFVRIILIDEMNRRAWINPIDLSKI